MSTKAIREALKWLPEVALKMPTAGSAGVVNDEYAAAMAEVEAIERAAKEVTETIELRACLLKGAAETLESIARDAP